LSGTEAHKRFGPGNRKERPGYCEEAVAGLLFLKEVKIAETDLRDSNEKDRIHIEQKEEHSNAK
jgi:hypothetical protein